MKSSRLSKLVSEHGTWVKEDVSGIHVYDVSNQHVLVQAAGYLKHVWAKESVCSVFFRGQSKLYPSLEPSLYRGAKTEKQKMLRDKALVAYLKESEGNVMRAVPDYAREALLQHYGIRTRWLDVVDNIWIALWFACHTAHATGRIGEYLHFERRRPAIDPKAPEYAYVLMVKVGTEVIDSKAPGLFSGADTELIDLRIAAPSTFLRPHSQHGLLFRRSKWTDYKHMDNAEFVVGVLRVGLRDALDWLGEGSLTSIHALFPPATYDFGYRELLNSAPPGDKTISGINVIGA
ncbi:FRG domain-containing protein [Synechococcus sp. CS-1325]|uniref:FRG domain-containing protein n=1 Tax=Synechococcus sp. CS-1325 TaxID=2847979 RepID=UPI00223B651B|nr:FRG domain-containing protein [Synechococcus sp. CS-1325]MCT0200204.1 FRG domain-containing protein [Synechococcus sp. CS-1325]